MRAFKKRHFIHIGVLLAGLVIGIFLETWFVNTYYQVNLFAPNQAASPSAQKTVSQTVKTGQLTQQVINSDQENILKYLTVQATLLGVNDGVSIYFKDLNLPEEVGISPVKSWIPASTIKSFVAIEAFRQRDLGLVDFNKQVSISAQNVVPTELESDDFPRLREGTTASIGQLVQAMIIQSDNTAYNSLLDILDRRNITKNLSNLSLTETVVGEKLNQDDNQLRVDQATPGYQGNSTTAKDLATMFDLLYNHKIADSDEILSIFKRQKINNMIPALLPNKTVVAHKTGDWAPIYHDSGIVFKPNDPFILTIMTNSGDPRIVAKLAEVAYYRNSSVVGPSLSLGNNLNPPALAAAETSLRPTFQLDNPSTNVLAATTQPTPKLTAADLGIKDSDFNPTDGELQSFNQALVTPKSIFYGIKRLYENAKLAANFNSDFKANVYLESAKSRLAEVKTLLASDDTKNTDQLLKESEVDLTKATELANGSSNKSVILLRIKHLVDLHYAILAQSSGNLLQNQKEQFVDAVYNFHQQEQKDIAPATRSTVIVEPTQQKPTIGTITQVNTTSATIQLPDGSTKTLALTDATKVKTFESDSTTSTRDLHQGDSIAVIGLNSSSSKIVPQLIMKNVPKDIASKKQGVVTEINPTQGTITIVDPQGNQVTINVGDQTNVMSSKTNVSLEGIKAGSQIAIAGVSTTLTGSAKQASSSAKPATPSASASASKVTTPPATGQSIKAITVTVLTNGSGKNEKIVPKVSAPAPTPVKKSP